MRRSRAAAGLKLAAVLAYTTFWIRRSTGLEPVDSIWKPRFERACRLAEVCRGM